MLMGVLILGKVQHTRPRFFIEDNRWHTKYRFFRLSKGIELQEWDLTNAYEVGALYSKVEKRMWRV